MDIFQNLLSVVQGDVYLDCPLQRASLESSFKHTFMYADKKFMRSRFDARMLLLLQLQLSAVTHQLPMQYQLPMLSPPIHCFTEPQHRSFIWPFHTAFPLLFPSYTFFFVVVIVFIYTSFSTFYLTCMLLKSELFPHPHPPTVFFFSNTNISSNFCHTTSKLGGLLVCCHHFPPPIRGSFCLSYHPPLLKNSS